MRMRNFQPGHHHPHLLTGNRFSNRVSYLFREAHQSAQQFVVEIENIIDFLFRNDQRVTGINRFDIEEGQILFVLGNFMARNFCGDDAGKLGRHKQNSFQIFSNALATAAESQNSRNSCTRPSSNFQTCTQSVSKQVPVDLTRMRSCPRTKIISS